MKLFSNAKINLGLSVLERREDGFHNIESLFVPVAWYDEIEIHPSESFQFSSNGIEIDGSNDSNLCVKAYQLLKDEYHISPVSIHLNKQIPIGAGLGGGSSNAAFVLKGLNDLFQLNLSIHELEQLADKLGSDCSFFIQNTPSMVSGKGDKINSDIQFKLTATCLLVYPNFHISTQEAYQLVKAQKRQTKIEELIQLPFNQWSGKLINDFEEPILGAYPVLKEFKLQLVEMGAKYVSMSGSGSTFYALFERNTALNFDYMDYPHKIIDLNF